ncbi:hypothetical protein COLO4_24501 [Corchorus olitorius]|uniref:Uncharacterized protein n=1 Tax=Corchorus olitorius TaxID=93759 RepID=A0A1R3I9N1_9ROSI|nr:hypothetical protein COLO4_24501 [Corchorus olitorius]
MTDCASQTKADSSAASSSSKPRRSENGGADFISQVASKYHFKTSLQ